MTGVTEELNNIREALDKGTDGFIQLKRYEGTVKKILERDPKNVLALYLKAKLLILSTKSHDRIKIRLEVINLVNEMATHAHSAVYYHRKWEILKDLNVQDDDVYQERKNACQEILKTPRNSSSEIYHRTAEKFLGSSRPPQTTGHPPKKKEPEPTSFPDTRQPNRPRADFAVDKSSGEPPLTVQFFDQSSGNPHTWNWEFGDSSKSSEASPANTYYEEGQYTVTLTVSNKVGSDVISKSGMILVAVRLADGPDSDGIYGKAIAGMVKDYPEIIDLIRAGPDKQMQLKGYILDAFGGETPIEFHILTNCIDEDIPLVILENVNEKIKLNAKVETKKVSLKNRGSSPEFVDWAVEVWKSSLLNENMTNQKTPAHQSNDDLEIVF